MDNSRQLIGGFSDMPLLERGYDTQGIFIVLLFSPLDASRHGLTRPLVVACQLPAARVGTACNNPVRAHPLTSWLYALDSLRFSKGGDNVTGIYKWRAMCALELCLRSLNFSKEGVCRSLELCGSVWPLVSGGHESATGDHVGFAESSQPPL